MCVKERENLIKELHQTFSNEQHETHNGAFANQLVMDEVKQITQGMSEEQIDDLAIIGYMAMVTRPCTDKEVATIECQEARKKEMEKIMSFDSLGMPEERQAVVDRLKQMVNEGVQVNDTVSGMMMIDAIKFAEMGTSMWKFKGRLVVHGHRIRNLITNIVVTKASTDLWAPVCQLYGIRLVLLHALVNQYTMLNWDVINAYLNVKYTENNHWLELPRNLWVFLPIEHRTKAEELKDPIFPMKQCVYGHPVSGLLYINEALDTFKKHQYMPTDAGASTLMTVLFSNISSYLVTIIRV